MFTVKIKNDKKELNISALPDCLLSDLLRDKGIFVNHPCGGNGKCGKCIVKVNGENVLSCKYRVHSDITVEISETERILSSENIDEKISATEKMFIALDIGTTTVAGALCKKTDGKMLRNVVMPNPQRAYGADVISRISHCAEDGPDALHKAIISCINRIIGILSRDIKEENLNEIYVSGNTVMLHLLMNVDCSLIGVAPYTPAFLAGKEFDAGKIGINGKFKVYTLPCIGSFAGADITAGINYIGMPQSEKYHLLADLGTNAEIVLWSRNEILCTSAAAGPCFEGANITNGMTGAKGAVCSYKTDGTFDVIGNTEPEGICASGLIDIISVLLKKGIIDESGNMRCEKFEITEDVFITRDDIRQYQLAKSAVYSAMEILIKGAGIGFDDIDEFYVAGGFSKGINIENAVNTGLFSEKLKEKFNPVDNSSLKGTIAFAKSDKNLCFDIDKAKYVDLSTTSDFSDLFIENMMF